LLYILQYELIMTNKKHYQVSARFTVYAEGLAKLVILLSIHWPNDIKFYLYKKRKQINFIILHKNKNPNKTIKHFHLKKKRKALKNLIVHMDEKSKYSSLNKQLTILVILSLMMFTKKICDRTKNLVIWLKNLKQHQNVIFQKA